VKGAKVHFAGLTRKTNKHGRAIMHVRLKRSGMKRATVTRSGLLKGSVKVRVRKPRR
jgi:hypothetical protein